MTCNKWWFQEGGSLVAHGVTVFLFGAFRHQPGRRAEAPPVKDHQALSGRHVQVSPAMAPVEYVSDAFGHRLHFEL